MTSWRDVPGTNVIHTSYSIADYCGALKREEISVNHDYQRESGVWPDIAQSFLIETILLNFPMPKLSLYQTADIDSLEIKSEIVDGQQRTHAIQAFYANKLVLSQRLETKQLKGMRFTDLPDYLKRRFLAYALDVDLFVGVESSQVRDAFRRMNTYTVPLNEEEQRHATYQGPFKWFINSLTLRYDKILERSKVFPGKQLVRMRDARLFSEVAHALFYGIQTTKKEDLDNLYEAKDDKFPEEPRIEKAITDAMDEIIDGGYLGVTAIARPFMVYSLILAVIQLGHTFKTLSDDLPTHRAKSLSKKGRLENLELLGEAYKAKGEGEYEDMADFYAACSGGTNVGDKRVVRTQWFYDALTKRAFP